MAWKFKNPKTGELYDVEEQFDESSGIDTAREKAIAKGYVPVASVVNPKTGESHLIDDRTLDKALAKGYKTEERAKNEANVYSDIAARQKKTFEDGAKGKAISAAKGFADTATYGFGDEIAGVDTAIRGRGENESLIDAYRRGRDTDRLLAEKSWEVNPVSTGLGAATAVLPTLAAGGGTVPTVQKMMGQGMVEGALYGAGASNADLTKGEFTDFTGDIRNSAATGAAVSGVMGGLSRGRRALADELAQRPAQEFAEEAIENSALKRVSGDSVGVPSGAAPKPPLESVMGEAQSPQSIREKVTAYLRNKAEKLAENATGATGKQSEKFSDKAGRELLKRGIVGVGDNAESIARKSAERMEISGKKISDSLAALDARGGNVDKQSILDAIDGEITALSKDPSKGGVIRQLKSLREDIDVGPSNYKLADAENVKRGYQGDANYDLDKSSQLAKKKAASAYQKEVERVAEGIDPSITSVFKKGKEDYGLLAPIEEAAAKRAATLNQSPVGGLLDTAATGVGGALLGYGASGGDPISGIGAGMATAFGRRQLMPRVSSTAAVGLDKAATFIDKMSLKIPALPPKYQGVLQNAVKRGGNAVAVTHFLLGNQDPEYRRYMESEDEDER